MEHDELKKILEAWGIGLRRVREDMAFAGSPERCIFRIVVEDESGGCFVLERIAPGQLSRRREMGAVLRSLRERGLDTIQTYLPDTRGESVAACGGDLWQISPYRDGVPLPRPGYISDAWRGAALADFLVNLKGAASPGLPLVDRKPFSILHFIDDLGERMKRHDPAVLNEVAFIIPFLLEDFGEAHDRLPVLFCHGDLHPVNVIWSKDGIRCVIDWEFMGFKPEVYDAANLIGCIGMEHPEGLAGPLVRNFLGTLGGANFLSPPGRRWLAEAVIALRFAWLSEWLRKGDREMVDLEVVYLKLLMGNRDSLREAWDLSAG